MIGGYRLGALYATGTCAVLSLHFTHFSFFSNFFKAGFLLLLFIINNVILLLTRVLKMELW